MDPAGDPVPHPRHHRQPEPGAALPANQRRRCRQLVHPVARSTRPDPARGLACTRRRPARFQRKDPRPRHRQSTAPARDSSGGEFFYRFHFQLQMPYPWGRWLSTFCALMMLVGLVTGIITHKKIFKEFFTFRPGKGQRSWLDGHNAIGVLVLPFHLMISYSSLVIFMAMVMPASISTMYGDNLQAYYNELFSRDEPVKPAGAPGTAGAVGAAVCPGASAGARQRGQLGRGAEPR
ncbi:PepSY domain-containing protein [Pseudomonas qingdaonensis]|nr:PepSY domain-containing protein [Pseudomonas qingdaonensis]